MRAHHDRCADAAGTDTVVMQEQVEVLPDQRIRIDARHRSGQNVRQAGEDIASGCECVRVRPLVDCRGPGVLASLGFAELRVFRRPRVAFFSTGDELRSIGETLAEVRCTTAIVTRCLRCFANWVSICSTSAGSRRPRGTGGGIPPGVGDGGRGRDFRWGLGG